MYRKERKLERTCTWDKKKNKEDCNKGKKEEPVIMKKSNKAHRIFKSLALIYEKEKKTEGINKQNKEETTKTNGD